MTVYYLNPYSSTNGTGTFASPYSASSTTRTAWVSGDELRILGNTIPLFTTTTYTATRASDSTMTIASGGGLGADWSVGNWGYIVEDDTFFYVGNKSTNTLIVGSLTPMPWANSVTGSTRTIRRFDSANLAVSSSSSSMSLLGNANAANVIITDGWTSATTRVTNGSVKSLFRGGSNWLYYFESSLTSTQFANNTFDMGNSYLAPVSSSGTGTLLIRGRDSTYNIAQLTLYGTTAVGEISLGTNTFFASNNNITIKSVNNYYQLFFGGSIYGDSNVININNYYAYYADALFITNGGAPTTCAANTTINFKNYVFSTAYYSSPTSYFASGSIQHSKLKLDYSTALWETAATGGPSYYVVGVAGDLTLKPPSTVYVNRRATLNPTPPATRVYFNSGGTSQKLFFDTSNIALGVAATTPISVLSTPFSSTAGNPLSGYSYIADLKKPMTIGVEFASSANSANMYNMITTAPINILQTYRDGSDPIEILGIKSNYNSSSYTAPANFPNVFRDTITVRTTGPSFKSYLTTRTNPYWVNSNPAANGTAEKSYSYKNIKIPIVSGSTYTITGYIRSDYSSSTTGDVIMSIIYSNSVLATQNMTSAMYNSWEQFTLSFTASATGEAYLVWEMYYPTGAMSYWLDDLTITKA